MRNLAIVIVMLVLELKTCTPARAQQVWPVTDASVQVTDSPDHYKAASAVQTDTAIRAAFDDHTMLPLDETVSISDQMSQAPWQEQAATPCFEEPQDDVLDECCCSPCVRACPSVYFQIEALFLWRDNRLIDQPILVDPNTGITYLSTSDLGSGFNYGVRETFGMRICGCRALEFSYFGLFQDSESDIAVSPDPGAFLIFPGNFFGNVFVGIDRLQADYASRLNSLEANLPCCCGCCDEGCQECCDECDDNCRCPQVRCQSYEWFAGFRYLNVDEDLNILAQRTVGGAVEEGSYDIRTDNNLYGLQLGGRKRSMRGRFGWEAAGKVGIFANDARQQQSVTDFPDFPLRPTVSSSSTNVAYLAEANLSGLYQLNHVWNLRAGYTAMWIEGLALAPDQLDFDFASATGGNQLHNGGAIFLHGVNVGIEARW